MGGARKKWENRAHFLRRPRKPCGHPHRKRRRKSRLKHGGRSKRMDITDLDLEETSLDEKLSMVGFHWSKKQFGHLKRRAFCVQQSATHADENYLLGRDRDLGADRSEERRVGKECRSRWS